MEKRKEDAALLRNTQFRLNGLKKLKDWAIESVLSNLDVYTQEGKANDIKTKLSPELRDNVLQELLKRETKECNTMEDFTGLKRLVFVLMNTRTYKLDLDVLMSFCPSHLNPIKAFIEVLRMVSIAAPNVRHLKMNTSD